MTKILAFSVGDPGSSTSIGNLPPVISSMVNDPRIISHTIGFILSALFFATVFLVFVFTVYQAYKYIISQGDKKELETVRGAFWNGIIGLIVVCISFLLVNIVGYFFHLNLFHTTLQ